MKKSYQGEAHTLEQWRAVVGNIFDDDDKEKPLEQLADYIYEVQASYIGPDHKAWCVDELVKAMRAMVKHSGREAMRVAFGMARLALGESITGGQRGRLREMEEQVVDGGIVYTDQIEQLGELDREDADG